MQAMKGFDKELAERDLLTLAQNVCAPFHVRPQDLKRAPGERQSSALLAEVRARFARRLLARPGWGYSEIARLLGYASHTSVMCLIGAPGVADKHKQGAARRAIKFAHVGQES